MIELVHESFIPQDQLGAPLLVFFALFVFF